MKNLENEPVDFSGAKIAIFVDDDILTILRDNRPDIPFPNMWDLPGGGREDQETPFDCIKREVFEELGIRISKEDIIWSRFYPGMTDPDTLAFFAVSRIEEGRLTRIRFGDEGQGYRLMKLADFFDDARVIPFLKNRLKDYLLDIDQKDDENV